jgi:hypothetical protein
MGTYYNLYNLDLSYWNLSVAKINLAVNDGIHQLDVSMNSTNTTFEGYDTFVKDLHLMHTIRRRAEVDPAVKDAFEKLLTVMAMTGA